MDEDADSMDWHATTPPSRFHPYASTYIPGGWPLEAPTPTGNVFARKARPPEDGGFLPGAKKICLGIAGLRLWVKETSYKAGSALKQYTKDTITSTRAIIQRYKDYGRRRRRAAYNARPFPHLRESPFLRAIRARETPFERLVRLGARSDYQTLRGRPNPFAQLSDPPPFSLNSDAAAAHTAQPPYQIPWFEEPMPVVKRRHPCENPFSNIPILPPPPPAHANSGTAPRTIYNIPPPSGTVKLDDLGFPVLKPDDVFPHTATTSLPGSPSTHNLPYHSELPKSPSPQLDQPSAQLLTDLNSPRNQPELGDTPSTQLDSPSAYPISPPQLDSPSAQLTANLNNHLYLASSPDSPSSHLKRILSTSRYRTSTVAIYGTMRRGPRGPRDPLRFPRSRMLTPAITHTGSRSTPGEDPTDSCLSNTMSRNQLELYLVEQETSQSEHARRSESPCPPPRNLDDTEQTPQSDEAVVEQHSPEHHHDSGDALESGEAEVEQHSLELLPGAEQPQSGEAMVERRSPGLRQDVEEAPASGEAGAEQSPPESRHDDGLEEEQTLQEEGVVVPEETAATKNPPSPVAASPEELAGFGDMNIKSAPESPVEPVSPKAVRYGTERTSRRTRAQAAKEKHEKEARAYKRLAPLDADWQDRVVTAVQHGHGNLQPSDLRRVVPLSRASGATDNWLNDEVINEYLKLVVTHGKKNDRGGQVPSHHAFNSFFYSNLAEKGPESVKRWAQRAKISAKSLLQTKAVFIPINSGAHWTLAVVSGEDKTITHYNSLAGNATRKLEVIKSWVEAELGTAFKEEEWTLAEGQSPHQTNMDDCGVFTVTSARQIMLGFTPMSYGADDIGVQRQRIVAELVNGGLLKAVEDT